jgi:hypothetical protein
MLSCNYWILIFFFYCCCSSGVEILFLAGTCTRAQLHFAWAGYSKQVLCQPMPLQQEFNDLAIAQCWTRATAGGLCKEIRQFQACSHHPVGQEHALNR